jgi:hypothetical protein
MNAFRKLTHPTLGYIFDTVERPMATRTLWSRFVAWVIRSTAVMEQV